MSCPLDDGILVVLPAFNEASTVGTVVGRLRARGWPVVVIDDGSTDETRSRAARAGASVVRLERNAGKGVALQHGFDHARAQGARYVVTMDADGQHHPDDAHRLVEACRRGGAPVVIGNRMEDAGGMPRIRRYTNRWMSRLLSHTMHQNIPDTQCGLRLYRLDSLEGIRIRSPRFAAESELLLRLAHRGAAIESVPIRTIYGTGHSKIRPLRDTLRFLHMLVWIRRDP